ncbi:unnamed protein product [Spirodela intermedia]|uniref:Transcription factor CBF/NF-Y/archaeal histone domain-containing protein n=1 Tax=Spirodela intermedia TaxID=51605 RepID=A0A7I8KAY8_SPIIN|nr:unnamed protein product [Spirodela intermedia]
MGEPAPEHPPAAGAVEQLPYGIAPYPVASPAFPVAPPQLSQEQLSYQQIYQQHLKHLQQQLQSFWEGQRREIEDAADFKNHALPLARIKKIMKADEDVRMIAAEAPVLFARACEMFVLELTLRAWAHTEENKRRTLQKNDIAAAITRTDVFDFLVDIVPRDEVKEDLLMAIPGVGVPTEPLPPYYYVPTQVAVAGVMVGRPAVDHATMLYAQQPQAYAPPPPQQQQPWPTQQPSSDS